MELKDIKGRYDAIFSLGSDCSSAIQLQKNNLRPYAGVLDWMTSQSLADVNSLLRNRFNGFMQRSNMTFEGIDAHHRNYVYKDTLYNINSVHDFPIGLNTPDNLVTYSEFRSKMDRRIRRFLEKMSTCNHILFVRAGKIDHAILDLHVILSSFVRHQFKLLLVEYTGVTGIVEHPCSLDNVTLLEMQGYDIWRHNDHLWQAVFDGISLV